MSQLTLGYIPKVKWDASFLLSCTDSGISELIAVLQAARATSRALHEVAAVSARHPAKLFVSASAVPGSVTWVVDDDVLEKVASLAGTGAGHQFFALAGTDEELLVSVNEYDDEWWAHA